MYLVKAWRLRYNYTVLSVFLLAQFAIHGMYNNTLLELKNRRYDCGNEAAVTWSKEIAIEFAMFWPPDQESVPIMPA